MKLEHQLTSLELSQRLKELGVNQESIYYWKGEKLFCCCEPTLHSEENDSVCAFSVAEIGEILKSECSFSVLLNQYDVAGRGNFTFDVNYWATVLIYLIENGLLTPSPKE